MSDDRCQLPSKFRFSRIRFKFVLLAALNYHFDVCVWNFRQAKPTKNHLEKDLARAELLL